MRISLLEKESATGSTLRSHEQSMEHKDATIRFSRRCLTFRDDENVGSP